MARTRRTRSQAVYGFLLGLYAPAFLARHRAEMLQNFEDLENASSSRAALWLLVGKDLMLSIVSRNIPKSIWGHAAPAFIVLAAALAVLRAFAYDLAPVSGPEALGFSSSRLARIEAWQQAQVDAGAFSGAVAAIARNGKVTYLRAVGFRDRAKTVPLQSDAIFWIASMTKPVTSVAAMMLVEEGKLDLAAPVHRYLPELRDMMVGVETTDPVSGQKRLALEPQKRPMTVEDLLRQTSGLVYFDRGNSAVHKLYRDSGLYDKGLARDTTLKDFVSRVARLPLAHQPGEVWEYGHSADVLGRVIEIVSGQPLDQFLDSRRVQAAPHGRHRFLGASGEARPVDRPAGRCADSSGSGRHQADDAVFGRRRAGVDGRRLSAVLPDVAQRWRARRCACLDARDRPADDHERAAARDPLRQRLDLWARLRDPQRRAWSAVPGSVGSFTWSGVWGTYFWVDPAEQLVAVQLIQVAPGKDGPINRTFRNLTYGALLVPGQGVSASAETKMTPRPGSFALLLPSWKGTPG